jgi:hypothetical protein
MCDDAEVAYMIELQSRLGGDEDGGELVVTLESSDRRHADKTKSRAGECAARANVLRVTI